MVKADQADKSSREAAHHSLNLATKAIREFAPSKLDSLITESQAIGNNVLQHELGYYGDWDGQEYELDRATLHRLIAHAREDAATAHTLAAEAVRQSYMARRAAMIGWALLAIVIALQIILIAR